jgi:hypothetical protein
MSDYAAEDTGAPTGAPASLDDTGSGDTGSGAQQLARYSIHIPVRDNNKNEIPHVLAAVRQALSDSGFPGRTVLRKAEGDWTGAEGAYDTEEMDLVMVDAPDTDENLQAILQAAKGVKDLADQEAVYVTVQPLRTYIV